MLHRTVLDDLQNVYIVFAIREDIELKKKAKKIYQRTFHLTGIMWVPRWKQ